MHKYFARIYKYLTRDFSLFLRRDAFFSIKTKNTMELGAFYNQTSDLSCFSPNSKYIATVLQNKLIIREISTLKVLSTVSKQNLKIQEISWSPNSEYVMTACYKNGCVSIFSVDYKNWIFHIEDGIIGLANVKWSWDGKYILCFSDFEVFVQLHILLL